MDVEDVFGVVEVDIWSFMSTLASEEVTAFDASVRPGDFEVDVYCTSGPVAVVLKGVGEGEEVKVGAVGTEMSICQCVGGEKNDADFRKSAACEVGMRDGSWSPCDSFWPGSVSRWNGWMMVASSIDCLLSSSYTGDAGGEEEEGKREEVAELME